MSKTIKVELDKFVDCEDLIGLKLDQVRSYYKDLVKFYSYNSTKNNYYIEGLDSVYDKQEIKILADFGIMENNFMFSRNCYIMYVNPYGDLKDAQLKFIEDSPDDVEPTHVFINSNDVKVIEETYKKICEQYPNIECVQHYLDDSLSKDYVVHEIMDKIHCSESDLFDISSYCKKLEDRNSIDLMSMKCIKEIDKIAEEIHSKCGNRIIYNSSLDDVNNMYVFLIEKLYLQYHHRFYAKRNIVEMIETKIMRLFDKDFMLVEEMLEYFNKLPNLLIELFDTMHFEHIVRSKSFALNVDYLPINFTDRDSAKKIVLNSDNLNLKKLTSYFDIDTIDGCKSLKSIISRMYDKIDNVDLIDVTSIIIFELDGETNIGYVREREFKAETVAVLGDIVKNNVILDYNRLRKCLPVDLYLDAPAMMLNICKNLKVNPSNLRLKPSINNERINGFIINDFNIRETDELWEGVSLSTVGLFSKPSSIIRTSLYKEFVEKLGLDETRSIVDCFGGFTPGLTTSIDLGGNTNE